jgi:6-phosphofructokinase 1
MSKLLVAQSGGPTAAINATLAGVLDAAANNPQIDGILGGINGIEGVLKENFLDLTELSNNREKVRILWQTPAAALGSCRWKLKSEEEDAESYKVFVSIMKKYDIGYFVYIGGNDSMDTVDKLSAYCRKNGVENLCIIGAPKTIDNDLMGTDHCPGFGSAAKYIATTIAEIERDCHVYTTKAVTVVEIMGRNAGWLTAASALSRIHGAKGPDMIYLCERPFVLEECISKIRRLFEKQDAVLIAISEGVKDDSGHYISEVLQPADADAFGHVQIAGVATVLADQIKKELGCKTRAIAFNLMQRASASLASKRDVLESYQLGSMAAKAAIAGQSGKMTALRRLQTKDYAVEYELVDVSMVSNREKKVPLRMIAPSGDDVTQEMMDYLLPLIQGLPDISYADGLPLHLSLYE